MPVFNQSRSYIIRLLFIVVFLVILAQLFNLQIISGKYEQLAQANAILKKPSEIELGDLQKFIKWIAVRHCGRSGSDPDAGPCGA